MLIPVTALSALAMTLAAAYDLKLVAALAAAGFAATMLWHAARGNRQLCLQATTGTAPPVSPRTALASNIGIIVLILAWGALTLFAIYLLTPVRWQHGWQYASAMLLLAGLETAYVRALDQPGHALATPAAVTFAARLGLALAAAIAGGLTWLLLSGKLAALKGDWAANQVFVAGGIAIAGVLVMIARTHATLTRAR